MHNADSNKTPLTVESGTSAANDNSDRTGFSLVKHLPRLLRDKISDRPNLRALIANSGWLFSDKILRMGVGLIVGVWVARYLGPGRFGLLNYAAAFAAIFSAVATLGLDTIVVRELVKFREKRDVILGSSFALRLLAALTTFAIVIAAISIMRRGQTLTIWIVALSAAGFIFQSLNVIDLFFQSNIQSKYTVYATNGAFVLMALVKVGLLLAGAPLIAFAWAALGEIAFASLFLLVAYRARGMNVWAWRLSFPVMRDLLRDSWPLIFSGISIMISVRIDQVLIGQMLGDVQVGIYSAAARIAEVWYFIPWGIASSVFPLLVESKKQSEELYYRRLQQYYDMFAVLPIISCLIITSLASPLVKLLYGSAYIGSVGPLRILIWSGVTMSIGAPWTHWMLLENRTQTMFHFQLFGAALNVILNVLLIPRFGIMGSAYATLISYGAWAIVLCPIMKSQRKPFTMMVKAIFLVWLFKWITRPEGTESEE